MKKIDKFITELEIDILLLETQLKYFKDRKKYESKKDGRKYTHDDFINDIQGIYA